MFTRLPGRRAVVSDEGFSVERTGSPLTQFIVRYAEGDHVLEYPLEDVASGHAVSVVVGSVGPWLPPYQSERVSPERQKMIANRIRDGMMFMGDQVEVVSYRPGD